MKSAVETLEPTKVKLTVEVTYDELKPSIDHAYQHIAEQVNVPGFRKGKVPPRIIDQRVGRPAVIEHAVNEGLSGFYAEAVRENKLRPLGQPEVEVTKVPGLVPGEDAGELHFTAEVEVRPEITVPALDGLTLTVDDVEVSDEDVQGRLDALRERFGTLVGVDRPAAEGDFVVLDLTASIDGEEVDSVSGVSYQIGSGNMLEGLDEALTGLSAGETTTFETALAGGERAGEQAQVSVTATTVKERQLPDADDDFAQLASEFDTLEELTADLREQAGRIKASNQAVQARDLLLEKLLEGTEIPVPQGVIDAEVHRHLEGEGRLEDDEHRTEVGEQATTALRNQILLDTLAEQLEIKISQQELLDYLVSASRQYGMDPNTFIQTVDQQGQIPAMVAEVARSKALAVALRRVAVVDGAGAAVDLSEYIGTDEEDAAADAAEAVAEQGATDAATDISALSDAPVEAEDAKA
ncbi:trigger factor [Cellulomonas fimi]|uniref:Trigger factor n=1 Tax=Cellulomonas fimi (strain ATCC 484 / DSM 20113 / JCM 1341 / CCUG 24087 / LMG 16345 / NBRC 15513 / NCIMB 8980 / NCTC 7547 / NRS-133) TaxID=590998 RepID=F4H5W4_CELFA|nr:trigger factor [Cellulomonas fimi]AEE45564.1 trigger factor [Cellulomonas fimi ATCC 484]NNH05925.1 trigger factor [Cellulomonas fimi]VEH29877.1 Trigger factor [Cellulomonas fimi]